MPPSSEHPPAPDGRRRILALLAVAELLGMSLWFTASAVAPQLRESWGLTPQQAAWLTTVVQLGFVAGTACAALLNLADVLPARGYFTVSALLAAAANALLVLAPGYAAALALRFLTGFFLAGVYPPAMKMVATWFRSGRGLAIGTVVGALTLGKATPYLTRALDGADVSRVVLLASAGAASRRSWWVRGTGTGPIPSRGAPSPGGWWGRWSATARHAWPPAAISVTCGSCTLCGLSSTSSLSDFFLARGVTEAQAGALSGLWPSR